MKKTVLVFFLAGLVVAYLYLLQQRQSVNVVQPPREEGVPFDFSFDEAPKGTLRANIMAISGDVNWISRTATEQAELKQETLLQQGEDVIIGDGNVTFAFQNSAEITAGPDSYLSIIQTLPSNIVFKQKSGSAVFSAQNSPVSVIVLHLLAVTRGGMEVSLDSDTGLIAVRAEKGEASLGFNDLDYQSITVELQEGDTYLFDDSTRTGQIQ